MSTYLYEKFNQYVALATGSALTAWNNGGAALIVGELQPLDVLFSVDEIGLPTVERVERAVVGGARIGPDRLEEYRFEPGTFKGTFATETLARLAMLVCGKCTTTDDTPAAGFNTHVVAPVAVGTERQTPLNSALHVEYPNPTGAESVQYDLLSILGEEWTLKVDDTGTPAEQGLSLLVGSHVVGDALTKPEPGDLTRRSYAWGDLTTTFTYNTVAIPCEIKSIEVSVMNEVEFSQWDVNGVPAKGRFITTDVEVKMRVRPYTDDLLDIERLKHSAYAGDLALSLAFVRTADEDQCTIAFNKLYLSEMPLAMHGDRTEQFLETEVTLRLAPSGSVTFTEINNLPKTRYANPA